MRYLDHAGHEQAHTLGKSHHAHLYMRQEYSKMPLTKDEMPKNFAPSDKFVLFSAHIYSFKPKPCKYFERGFCCYGKKCRFIHRAESKSCELKKLVSLLKIEIETKFKELNIVISNQASEILELKAYLKNGCIFQATIV